MFKHGEIFNVSVMYPFDSVIWKICSSILISLSVKCMHNSEGKELYFQGKSMTKQLIYITWI